MRDGELLAFMAEVYAPQLVRIVRLEEALRCAIAVLIDEEWTGLASELAEALQ